MKCLLDTNAVTGLLKSHPGLSKRVRQHVPEDFGIPAVAAHELFFGAYRSQRPTQNLARVEALQFEVLEFDKEDARQAGKVRAAVAKVGTPIGPYDVLMSDQARARNLTLITHNVAGFSRVDDLLIVTSPHRVVRTKC